jgi:6-pyruvoyl-tetrahydropterin synthase
VEKFESNLVVLLECDLVKNLKIFFSNVLKNGSDILNVVNLSFVHHSLFLIRGLSHCENEKARSLLFKDGFLDVFCQLLLFLESCCFKKLSGDLRIWKNFATPLGNNVIRIFGEVVSCLNRFIGENQMVSFEYEKGVNILIGFFSGFQAKTVLNDSMDESETLPVLEVICKVIVKMYEKNINVIKQAAGLQVSFLREIFSFMQKCKIFKEVNEIKVARGSKILKALKCCMFMLCEIVRIESNSKSKFYETHLMESNNDVLLDIFKLTRNSKPETDEEDVHFFSCVVFGFFNCGTGKSEMKYSAIIEELNKYKKNSNNENRRRLAEASSKCLDLT